MDVCPVNCLDFKRPTGAGAEGNEFLEKAIPKEWMMTYPIQTAQCIGCNLCETDCPVQVISILKTEKEPAYKPSPGAVQWEDEKLIVKGFVPLSQLTRVSAKKPKNKLSDNWGEKNHIFKPLQRKSDYQARSYIRVE